MLERQIEQLQNFVASCEPVFLVSQTARCQTRLEVRSWASVQWTARYSLRVRGGLFLKDIVNPKFDCYRLVLISGTTRLILFEVTQTGAELPRVFVPRWTRTTEQIQDIAKERWGLKILVMDLLGDEPGGDGVVVAEVLEEGTSDRSRGRLWASLDEIGRSTITDTERDLIRQLLRGEDTRRGPFFRLGWIQGLYRWLESTPAMKDGVPFTSEVKQFNASPTSTLLRLRRADSKLFWFKAAGHPNEQESMITSLLADLLPGYLPPLIASHDAWNGWLMDDAGSPLDALRSLRLSTLEHVVRRLAELQKASASHVPALLLAGCRDQRTPALLEGIHELLPYLHDAMATQRLDCVPRIGIGRLRTIEEVLEQACFSLEWLGVPNSLIHDDIHPGNILVSGRRCMFTDWARASIGNPLITFAQLRDHLAHERRTHRWLPHLTRVYQEVWKPIVPDFILQRAFCFIPMIASATYLYDRRELLVSEHGQKPQLQRYVRSLVRQMDKAACALEEILTVCA
jgi:hypothetical protein